MLKVVYPGTFDPFTKGHEDLVRRAAKLFDRVVVGIADSESKRPMFTAAERIAMTTEVLAGYANVEVIGFSGLLMDFVHSIGASVIVRGLSIPITVNGSVPLGEEGAPLYSHRTPYVTVSLRAGFHVS